MPTMARFGAVVGIALLTLGLDVTPATAQGERLESISIDATVEPTGALLVRETIVWDFAGQPDKHGIFRFIPEKHRWEGERKRRLIIGVVHASQRV